MATCSEILAGKSSWPELLGIQGVEAGMVIEQENPNVKAELINQNTPIGEEIFKCRRVMVIINDDGIVTQIPKIG